MWNKKKLLSASSYLQHLNFLNNFVCSLQDRQLVRNLCRPGQRPNYHETDEMLVPVFRKLHSQGITEEDEDKLLFLREIILKLHRAKSRYNVKIVFKILQNITITLVWEFSGTLKRQSTAIIIVLFIWCFHDNHSSCYKYNYNFISFIYMYFLEVHLIDWPWLFKEKITTYSG